MSFDVLHLNLNRRYLATCDLDQRPEKLFLLMEPYIGKEGPPVLHKESWFTRGDSPRAAVYATGPLRGAVTLLAQFSERDVATVEIRTREGPIIASAIYWDGKKTFPNVVERLADYARRSSARVIYSFDANAHSTLYGCRQTNARGREMEDFIFRHDLQIENSGNEPTFVRYTNGKLVSSIIDVVLSSRMHPLLNNWKILSHDHISDHKPLHFRIGAEPPQPRKKRLWDKANWLNFKACLDAQLEGQNWEFYWSQKLIEERALIFQRALQEASNAACPEVTISGGRIKSFWNDTCQTARDRLRKVQKRECRRGPPSEAGRERIRIAQREYNTAIRNSKKSSWREFTQNIKTHTEMAKLCKSVKRKKICPPCNIIRPDGTASESREESTRWLLQEHFQGCRENTARTRPAESLHFCPPLEWITEERIMKAAGRFKPNKAAGLDGLSPIILKHLTERAILLLKRLYTASIRLGFTPSVWTRARVSFIPKGRANACAPNAFRPICLTSWLYKCLELLTIFFLEDTVMAANPLHKHQFAFRKGKSTEDAASRVVGLIERGLQNKQYVVTVLLDCVGAFSHLAETKIIEALDRRGVPGMLVRWMEQYLKERTAVADLGEGRAIEVGRLPGTNQGALLAPVYNWGLSFDSLLEKFTTLGGAISGFADDVAIVVTSICLDTALQVAQQCIDECINWGREHKLEFCPTKTVALLSTRKRLQPPGNLFLNGEVIKWSENAKYLGFHLDKHVNFHFHIEQKIASAKGLLARSRSMIANRFGPRPRMYRWLWTAIIRPMVTYGSFIWAKATKNKRIQEKLDRLQYLAMLQMAPVRRSTPRAALEIIYDLMPLHMFVNVCAVKTWHKIKRNEDERLRVASGHRAFANQLYPAGYEGRKREECDQIRIWTKSFQLTGEKENIFSGWTAWAAAARIKGKAGIGVILYNEQIKLRSYYKCLGAASLWQAECAALQLAAERLMEEECAGNHITIHAPGTAISRTGGVEFSQQSCINARASIQELGYRSFLTLTNIRKSSCPGYEQAKALAIQGTAGNGTYLLAKDSIHESLQKLAYDTWYKRWSKLATCRQSRFFLTGPNIRSHKLLMQLDRERLGYTIRFLTGHGRFRRMAKICGETESSICRLCGSGEEDPIHFSTDCSELLNLRKECFEIEGNPTFEEIILFAGSAILQELESQ